MLCSTLLQDTFNRLLVQVRPGDIVRGVLKMSGRQGGGYQPANTFKLIGLAAACFDLEETSYF
jgi:hypothetical protein